MVLKAIRTYQPGKASLSTYVSICVQNELRNIWRSQGRQRALTQNVAIKAKQEDRIKHYQPALSEEEWRLVIRRIAKHPLEVVAAEAKMLGIPGEEMARRVGKSGSRIHQHWMKWRKRAILELPAYGIDLRAVGG